MLHVFLVNRGDLLTFDADLLTETVLELKNAILGNHNISVENQVMLKSSGEALQDSERLCSYAAGTDTNPVYLYDKACIEKKTSPALREVHGGKGFGSGIKDALSMPPSYRTVDCRTRLALQLHDVTKTRVKDLKELFREQQLMFQGWQAGVSNLLEVLAGFQNRVQQVTSQCQTVLDQIRGGSNILDGLEDVFELLSRIPVLSPLLKYGKSVLPTNASDRQISLLDWIDAHCKDGFTVSSMLDECKRMEKVLNQERLESLVEESKKREDLARDRKLIDISGISERFESMVDYLSDVENKQEEQKDIAMAFKKNRDNAQELSHHSSNSEALALLCESHVNQLKLMVDKETYTRELLQQFMTAKRELSAELHKRLRRLYQLQRAIVKTDITFSMFLQQLTQLERQRQFLAQVKRSPALYLSSLTEVVRRKHFSSLYIKWANKAITDARVDREREIAKRKTFHSNVSGHFIQKLFKGFSDKPPPLSKKTLCDFDSNLPDITEEQLDTLSRLLPNYKDILRVSVSSSTSFLDMRSTISSPTSTAMADTGSLRIDGPTCSESHDASSMRESHTGSFAVVEPTSITHSPPGAFVVASVANLKEETNSEMVQEAPNAEEPELPQRAHSSATITHETILSSVESLSTSERNDVENLSGSPEFFSIIPASLGENVASRNAVTQNNESASVECPVGFESPALRLRRNSGMNVGSVDSNSYHKVDDLSSDDEMFHSFTSDQPDAKSLRKKIHQLQFDYQKLSKTSTEDIEDLNMLIKKLEAEIMLQKMIQQTSDSDYEKRCADYRAESEVLRRQLENEHSELEKAQTQIVDLESRLQTSKQECLASDAQVEQANSELHATKATVDRLRAEIGTLERDSDRRYLEMTAEKEEQIERLSSTIAKAEDKIKLCRAELTAADDRIQELEEQLSIRDRKEQDHAETVVVYEAKINELSDQLKVTSDSRQKSYCEVDAAKNLITEREIALRKARDKIESLQALIAGYETKLCEERGKDEALSDLKSKLAESEQHARVTASELRCARDELAEANIQLRTFQSRAAEISKSCKEELEGLKSAHTREVSHLREECDGVVSDLNEKHEKEVCGLVKIKDKAVADVEREMTRLMEEMSNANRDTLDELQADRLAEFTAAQQDIEVIREKLRESHRQSERDRREAAEQNEALSQKILASEQDRERLEQDKKQLLSANENLKEEIARTKAEIQRLSAVKKQDTGVATGTRRSASSDEETESKRTKVEDGSFVDGRCSSVDVVPSPAGCAGAMSAHQVAIEHIKRKFEHDKKKLENYYRNRGEEETKKRQIVFNSAVQQVTAAKDKEIRDLRERLMTQSLMLPASNMTGSMTIPQKMTMSTQSDMTCSFSSGQSLASDISNASTSSSETSRAKDSVILTNFQPGDSVLVIFNDVYEKFTLFTTARTTHFVHEESVKNLGLSSMDSEAKKTMTRAVLASKEYCQARKEKNRFRVPINTKFYRVKLSATSKLSS